MIRVTVLNQKGGVAKTSTCHHVSGAFAQMGLRVLLLDNDPQASLSQGIWGPVAALSIPPSETIAALYRGDQPAPELLIKETGTPGVSLVLGSVGSDELGEEADDWNIPRPQNAPAEQQACLREFLREVEADFDLVLIDNPPNLLLCSWASLVASDWLLVPTQPEDYGAQGLRKVMRSMQAVQAGANPGLGLMGYLLTMVSPSRAVHQFYEENLRREYGDLVFATRVLEKPDYPEAIAARKPITSYKPKGAPAKVMRALAREILDRAGAGVDAGTVEAA